MQTKPRKQRSDALPFISVTNSVNYLCARYPKLIIFFCWVFKKSATYQRERAQIRASIEKRRLKNKAYNDANREKRLESWHRRMQDPDFVAKERERGKQKFQDSKEKIYAYRKQPHRMEALRPYMAKYNRERRAVDPQWTMQNRLRSRLCHAVRIQRVKKSSKTYVLTGCSINELCAHLERQFVPGMTWENRSEWEIDHIRPCSSFDLTDPEQQKQCFSYLNLQPLWKSENRSKSDKILAVA